MRPTKNMRRDAAAAMPEVRAIVKARGLDVVAYCVAKLKANEKQLRKIDSLKREIATIEKQIS